MSRDNEIEDAYRLRIERCLQLPLWRWANPRIAEIANREHELIRELSALDVELANMFHGWLWIGDGI